MPGPTLASVLGAADNDDGKATVDNQSDSSLTPLGNLITLPPELRLMIYEHLIKSGSVIFLRTSSAVYNEAANTLYNQGVCNLELNVYRLPLVYPTAAAANKISNLQVRVNLTDKSQERNERCVYLFHIFEPFRQSLVPRKTCKILLDCHPSFVAHIPPQAFEIIGTLTGFETLILAIANDTEDCTTRVRSLMYSAKPDPRRQMDLALHGEVNENTLRAYEIAKVYLEGTLGPSKWVCDERGAHLEFHPRGFLSDDRSHQQGKLKTPLEWNG